ncbi:MAG: hypothetical protein ACTHMS_12120 [Jatrophihabitans sp.]|uniref:hypothetical protein n=1 Tax=Jatrophihabitans sp. TaxID=1932789 RepID=UPI003F7D44D5
MAGSGTQVTYEHVVVVGAGVAGWCAAAAVAPHCRRLTVVDRSGGTSHAADTVDLPARVQRALLALHDGLAPLRTRPRPTAARRGTVGALCAEVSVLPHVELRLAADALWLTGDPAVRSVEVMTASGMERLRADLVVDAGGRASRLPTWLAQLGHAQPPVETRPCRHGSAAPGDDGEHPTAHRRLRYDRLCSVPANVVAVGDAIVTLPGHHAVGIAVAGLHATALHRHLARGPLDPSCWFATAHRIGDAAWRRSDTSSPFRLPVLRGLGRGAAAT